MIGQVLLRTNIKINKNSQRAVKYFRFTYFYSLEALIRPLWNKKVDISGTIRQNVMKFVHLPHIDSNLSMPKIG